MKIGTMSLPLVNWNHKLAVAANLWGKSHNATKYTLVKEPPAGAEWMHELKFDGYRMLCRIDRGKATFWSRNEKEWTAKFLNVVESVKSLPLTTAILDVEIVM